MQQLTGTKAVITGGAGAIGLATARAFLREGANVHIVDLSRAGVDAAVAELAGLGACSGSVADLTVRDDVERVMREAAAALGGISALINNAGTVARAPLVDMRETDIDQQLAVNIKSVILCTQAAIPHLQDEPNASITSTASQAGKRGWAEIAVYGATKAAVIGFSRCMAVELAPAIRVNSICPGHVGDVGMAWRGFEARKPTQSSTEAFGAAFAEEHVPLKRLQSAEDIAAGFVYLTSRNAKEITGASLNIGGGVVMD